MTRNHRIFCSVVGSLTRASIIIQIQKTVAAMPTIQRITTNAAAPPKRPQAAPASALGCWASKSARFIVASRQAGGRRTKAAAEEPPEKATDKPHRGNAKKKAAGKGK